jgi:hypothetical protein
MRNVEENSAQVKRAHDLLRECVELLWHLSIADSSSSSHHKISELVRKILQEVV